MHPLTHCRRGSSGCCHPRCFTVSKYLTVRPKLTRYKMDFAIMASQSLQLYHNSENRKSVENCHIFVDGRNMYRDSSRCVGSAAKESSS